MMQTVKDRLLEYMAVKGLRNAQVEKKAGLSNAYIRNLKNCPKNEIIEKILVAFPDLNRVWLLTGSGEMLTPPPVVQTTHGDHSPAVAGNGNTVTTGGDASAQMVELLRDCLRAEQDNVQRLTATIEKMMEMINNPIKL